MITCASRAGEACGFGHLVFSYFGIQRTVKKLIERNCMIRISGVPSLVLLFPVCKPPSISPRNPLSFLHASNPKISKKKKKNYPLTENKTVGFAISLPHRCNSTPSMQSPQVLFPPP